MPRARGSGLPTAETERRLKAYHATTNDTEAAKSLGDVSQPTFYHWRAKTMGLPSKRPRSGLRGPSREDRLAAYHATNSDQEAADMLEMSMSTFQEWRWREGLPEKYTATLRLTRAEEQRRHEAYELAEDDGEAAKILGIPQATFAGWRASQGLVPKKPKMLSPEEELRRLWAWQETDNDTDAATILQIPRVTFCTWRTSQGLPSKGKRGRHLPQWPTIGQAMRKLEKIRAYKLAGKARRANREWRNRLKLNAFNAYGGPKCNAPNCTVADMRVLTMDHIQGDGAQHRAEQGGGTKLYLWLKRHGYPEGFQVLCVNHQQIKAITNGEIGAGGKPVGAAARHSRKLKAKVYAHYGSACSRCGFDDIRALNLDHVNGDGAAHRRILPRKGGAIYAWVVAEGFPPSIQVLCGNCNWLKAYENGELSAPLDGVWWYQETESLGVN